MAIENEDLKLKYMKKKVPSINIPEFQQSINKMTVEEKNNVDEKILKTEFVLKFQSDFDNDLINLAFCDIKKETILNFTEILEDEDNRNDFFSSAHAYLIGASKIYTEYKKLVIALDKISKPVKYLQIEAKKAGTQLNGEYAIRISNDASYLKNIAERSLIEISIIPQCVAPAKHCI